MQRHVKNAFVLLIAFFALLAMLGFFTGAFDSLKQANPALFALGAISFIASIFIWLVAWASLIKSRKQGFGKNLLLGFACVFAALTPIQIGADTLRSVKMKEHFSVSYTESIAASMVVKGIKFLIIALVASLAFLTALTSQDLSLWIKTAMVSGFAVVLMAALLFLLPIKQSIGQKIALLFKKLSLFLKPAARLQVYFQNYSLYLHSLPKRTIAIVFILAVLSIAFEFIALLFSFLSAGVAIPILSALMLFSILEILERTPFLPRGIGVFEAVGIIFLSTESFTAGYLGPGQIATVIILFDGMRLLIPTIASLAVYYLFFKS